MDQTYQMQEAAGLMALFAGLIIFVIIAMLAGYVIGCLGLMRMFQKAGRPGWAAFVPVYNVYLIIEMIKRPRWWFYVFVGYVAVSVILNAATSMQISGTTLLSVVGAVLALAVFVLTIIGSFDMARVFGRGTGTAIGLIFLPWIFSLILGFGSAEYEGEGKRTSAGAWGAGIGGGSAPSDPASPYAPSPYSAAPYAPAVATPGYPAASTPARWQEPASTPAGFASPPASFQSAPSAGYARQLNVAPSWPPLDDGARPSYTMAPPSAPVPPLASRLVDAGQPA